MRARSGPNWRWNNLRDNNTAPDLRENVHGQEGSTPGTDGELETTESRLAQEPRCCGQRPGAPGHGRTQSLPIDHERHHHPDTCAVCGGTLTATNAERTHSACLVIDLRELSADRAGLELM